MKLLGWMHRKLMHNSTDPLKSYPLGNHLPCFSDEQNYYIDPAKTPTRPSLKSQRSPNTHDDLFDILSIGTFGAELLLDAGPPPTPTLPTGDQSIEVTENDLDLISHELEKFLESEDAETGYDSSERTSRASVITLTDQGQVQMICPLQNYLLGGPVGLAEEVKKKTRMSLEELFKEGKGSVDGGGPPERKGEGAGGKEGETGNVARLVKKVVGKLGPASSDGTSGFDGDDDEGVFWPIKRKLAKKLVKMFHKKIYPEEMTVKGFFKVTKSEKKKKNNYHKDDHINGCKTSDQPARNKSKKNTKWLFCAGVCRGSSPVNAGHWIKTDSDYLVLEL